MEAGEYVLTCAFSIGCASLSVSFTHSSSCCLGTLAPCPSCSSAFSPLSCLPTPFLVSRAHRLLSTGGSRPAARGSGGTGLGEGGVFFFFLIYLYVLFRGLPNGSACKESTCDVGDAGDLGSAPGQEDPLEEEMVTHSSILT